MKNDLQILPAHAREIWKLLLETSPESLLSIPAFSVCHADTIGQIRRNVNPASYDSSPTAAAITSSMGSALHPPGPTTAQERVYLLSDALVTVDFTVTGTKSRSFSLTETGTLATP